MNNIFETTKREPKNKNEKPIRKCRRNEKCDGKFPEERWTEEKINST